MSNRIHGSDNATADQQLSRSIWKPGVVQRLADYIKQLRQVDQQSDKPNVSSQPDKPHVCERNPHRNCNCPPRVCADDSESYRYARGPYTYNQYAADIYTCPISGSICLGSKCREWCESGVDRTKT